MNHEKAVQAGIAELLVGLLWVPEEFKKGGSMAVDNGEKRFPIYLKYALRCLTSCVRTP